MKEVYTLADLRDWRAVTAEVDPPFRLAVLGNPVAHSASPPMQNAALRECGIAASYTRLQLRAEELREAFQLLPDYDFLGVNCTIPHKSTALTLVDRVDECARRIGAVNTIACDAGQLVGYNTDGLGFARAVQAEFGVELRGLRIMVLGAGGGAGRAIAMQCAYEKAARLMLINRTVEKLRPLAEELATLLPDERLAFDDFEARSLRAHLAQTDLVINCTSLGMQPDDASPIAAELLRPQLFLYDTIYSAQRTALMCAGDFVGARSANGLSMLLHQGALAFEIWFNRPAPIEAMRAALFAHFAR